MFNKHKILSELDNLLKDNFKGSALSYIYRTENIALWENALQLVDYVPSEYSHFQIEYQLEYQRGNGGECNDFSMILMWDQKPVGIWPITLSIDEAQSKLTSQGNYLLPPLFSNSTPKITQIKIVRMLFSTLINISKLVSLKTIILSIPSNTASSLTYWHTYAARHAVKIHVLHELFLNTAKPTIEIFSGFSSRLRREFKKGASLWNQSILTSHSTCTDEVFEEFKLLHTKVSGRKTKSDECWEIQKRYVKENQAFLSMSRDHTNRLIGCGLFNLGKNESQYAVGAYDRSLYELPVSHIIHQNAILEICSRGIPWYRLGPRPYENDGTKPTPKEISIGDFKEQLSSNTFPKYLIYIDAEKYNSSPG
jgi:FemAB family protein